MTLFFLENRSKRVVQLRNRKGAEAEGHWQLPCFCAGLPPVIEFIEMPESLRGKYQYFTQARMARCGLPDMPAVYLTRRRGQKICDRVS